MKYSPAKIYPDFPGKIAVLQRDLVKGKITKEQFDHARTAIMDEALSVNKWHVEYRYQNPNTKKKERFKVYEDINRFKGEAKLDYAITLRDAIDLKLEKGFDPFAAQMEIKEVIQEYEEKRASVPNDRSKYHIVQALKYFLDETKGHGASKSTNDRYRSHTNFFKQWLNERKMLLTPAAEITADNILSFLKEYNDKNAWTNKTYNNYLGTMQAVFNMLGKKIHGIIPHNPIEGAEMKTTLSRKHTAYSDEQLATLLKNVRANNDIFMEGIILTVYYACIRSKEELRNFKIGNILFDRDLIRLDAEGTKGRRDDYVPLDPELKKYYISLGFDKLNTDWYVFSKNGSPGPAQAWPNLYSERFRPYRDEMLLDDRYTIYGFKHTRCIHLALAGISPYAIIQLTRHKTLDQLMAYLRDLGVTINFDAVKNSREL